MSSGGTANGQTVVRQSLDTRNTTTRHTNKSTVSPDEEDTVVLNIEETNEVNTRLSVAMLKQVSNHTTQIAFRVSDKEKQELIKEGIREKVKSLSNLIRIRCGLEPL